MRAEDEAINKVPIVIALVLSLLLVIGVLLGAKIVWRTANSVPVAMSVLDTPQSHSAECEQVVAALPERLGGHPRAELAEPAPAGAAAWKSSSLEQITLRCGVEVPLQYSVLSPLDDVDGTAWLTVVDVTPGSSLRTLYAVNRSMVVALTFDDAALSNTDPHEILTEVAPAVGVLGIDNRQPHPLALSQLPMSTESSGNPESAAQCEDFVRQLPPTMTIGDDQPVTLTQVTATTHPGLELPRHTVAWVAKDNEPVVVRCGVEFPSEYQPGERLTQINDVTWFEQTVVANGTSSSTWFAVNHDPVVAVSVPQSLAQAVLVTTGAVVETTTSTIGS